MASQLNPTRLQDHYDKKMGYKDEEGNLTRAGIIGSESLGWVIVLPLVICCTALGRS